MRIPGVRSIRQKLNFILAATTVLALLLAGAALVLFDLRSQLHAIERELVTQADVMALVSAPAWLNPDHRRLDALDRARTSTRAIAPASARGRGRRRFRVMVEVGAVEYRSAAPGMRPFAGPVCFIQQAPWMSCRRSRRPPVVHLYQAGACYK